MRGHFKNVRGTLQFDPEHPLSTSAEVTIEAQRIWTGEPDRDKHLRSADFLDVENHPTITFRGDRVELIGAEEAKFHGDLTIRGVTRPVSLDVRYLGQWNTPWWEDGVDKGPRSRAGFLATTRINRKDFGVNWNDTLDRGGVVVSDDLHITIDAEAILES